MSKNPVLIPQAFAANGSKNNIQNTRQPGQDPEDATWSDGFPNVTMQPIESGGLPPKGMDFNGILNALSATIVHMQKGNLFYFDKVYCDAFGGYQKGAILLADDGTKVFISVADRNTNNPNQNPQSWEVIAGIGLNAASASKLFEGRNIGGVFFDGTQDIDLPGVNKPGNQSTTGNANTATKLQTARKITLNGAVAGSCSFNGEGDAVINTTQVIGLGLNQDVIDVTPWRAYGTVYVNQMSSPIFLAISFFHTNKREAQLWIDSTLVGEVTTSNEDSQRKAVYGIVPPGKSYILTGNLDIRVWAEVR